ncbi:hypothetical protein V6N12_009471 [Hibiscus sabdariffa]|uniref:Retrotransposon protein, putative, Ty1-copia subclass n=1 Tax=Hibiscus sabdariffa TaxID=183260 RepID=A0ABR2E978_9ROSI
MEESKRGFLPMRHGISLSKEMCPSTPQERERMSQIPYASAIGSIMYAMICHWTAVKNILKYLRRTKDVFLVFGGEEELRIKGYTDASFQTDKDDSRSQSGFVFCLNGGAVSWKSSKQDTVADSTTKAEYVSASEATKDDVWIKEFISELRVVPSILDAVGLYCDNNGAIAQAKEPRSHHGPKHTFKVLLSHTMRWGNMKGLLSVETYTPSRLCVLGLGISSADRFGPGFGVFLVQCLLEEYADFIALPVVFSSPAEVGASAVVLAIAALKLLDLRMHWRVFGCTGLCVCV